MAWSCSPRPAQPLDLAWTSSFPPLPSPRPGSSELRRTALGARNPYPVLWKQSSEREPAGAQGDILLHRAAPWWSKLRLELRELLSVGCAASCRELPVRAVFSERAQISFPFPSLPCWAALGQERAGSRWGCWQPPRSLLRASQKGDRWCRLCWESWGPCGSVDGIQASRGGLTIACVPVSEPLQWCWAGDVLRTSALLLVPQPAHSKYLENNPGMWVNTKFQAALIQQVGKLRTHPAPCPWGWKWPPVPMWL